MPEEVNKWRLKDENAKSKASYASLADPQKQFVNELETLVGQTLRFTSGRRTPEQQIGKASKTSKHNTGQALDLASEHFDVYTTLMNTREGLTLLNKYGMGILDETNPAEMKNTRATGAHFHLGTDSYYAKIAQDRLANFDKITPILSYKERVANGEVVGHSENDGHSHSSEVIEPNLEYNPLKMVNVIPDSQIMSRVIGKEMIKQTKSQKDADRQAVDEESKTEKEQLSRQEQFLQEYSRASKGQSNESQVAYNTPKQPAEIKSYEPEVDIQEALPNMPDIFQYQS